MKLKSVTTNRIGKLSFLVLLINTFALSVNFINQNTIFLIINILIEVIALSSYIFFSGKTKHLKHLEQVQKENKKKCIMIYNTVLPEEISRLRKTLLSQGINPVVLDILNQNITIHYKNNDPEKMEAEIQAMREHVGWLTGNINSIKEQHIKKPKSPFHQSKFNHSLEILGLSKNEKDFKKVRDRYHSLIRLHHPDQQSSTPLDIEKAKEINSAYNYLKDQLA